MELYAYASELFATKRADPHDDLMSVLTYVDVEGEKLSDLELELFFLLLTVAGNETTRNLISGAMAAFFDHPDQWDLLRNDRSLLPTAVEEMLRYVTPVMNFRRQTNRPFELGGQTIEEDSEGRVLPHLRQPGRGRLRGSADDSTSPATPTPTWPSVPVGPIFAWAPTWPAWRSG